MIIFHARPLSSPSRILAIRSSVVKAVNFADTKFVKVPEETNGDNQKTFLLVTVKFSYR